MIKTVVCVVSLVLNVLFFAFFALALSTKTAAVSFFKLDDRAVTSACIVTAPLSDPGTSLTFNTVEIALRSGSRAALQISAVADGRQSNWLFTALFDHSIISVEPTGFGIIITALNPGETTMQMVTADGIKDIAHVQVFE